MKILIIYATTEGQTRKIARFMEDVLQESGHQVMIADATDEPPSPAGYDMAIIGASIHMQRYQNAIKHYIAEHVELLNAMPSAFYSVCLAIVSDIEDNREEAEEIAEDFIEYLRWQPIAIEHIAGALQYSKYDYFKKLVMRMIAKKQNRDTDTSQDYEYTDWAAVRDFVVDLVEEE